VFTLQELHVCSVLLIFFNLALLGVASASGYQMVVSVGEAKEIKDMAITSLQVLIMSEFFDITLLYGMCWYGLEKCASPP